MPTKWTNKLSDAQLNMLLIVAGRPRFVLVHDRCENGIVAPFADEGRTIKALVKRGLVRWVWAQKDNVPSNGITLTAEGAKTLVPPGTVTWLEKAVHVPQLGAVLRKKPSQAEVDAANAVKDAARHKNAIDRAVLRRRGRGRKPTARKTIFT